MTHPHLDAAAQAQAEFTKAKRNAFRLLKVRDRSVHEIRHRLKQYGFPDAIVAKTIEYLIAVRLIDDRQFVDSWARTHLMRGYGIARIKQELQDKGIDPALLENELARLTQGYREEDAAAFEARKRALKYSDVTDKEKIQKRVFEYLAGRGFNPDAIEKAVEQL